MKELDERHIHDGHRGRMRDKLIKHDGDIFETYELLEMLLFFRLPYKNTNPIAKRLLHRFGSLRGVFEASCEELCEVAGIGSRCAAFLRGIGDLLCIESDDECIGNGGKCADMQDVVAMLHTLFLQNTDVSFVIVAFDNSGRVISTDVLYDVDYNSGSMNAAYYTDFALRTKASMIVTASNRRYGTALPKPADRESAAMVTKALDSIDVHYAEHFVFSGNNYARVMPTLTVSPIKMQILNEIVGELHTENIKNENKSCRNNADLSLFDEIVSSFCEDHIEKTSMLFERFGTLSSILITDYQSLAEIVGDKLATFVRVLSNVAKRRITDLVRLSDISNDRELGEYLSALCIPLNRETVFLISYDGDGKVISVDKVGEGTLNSSGVTPRALIEIAMRNSAKRVSIAHNHPYGKSEFSEADISFTKTVYEIFLAIGIELSKHYCISGNTVFCISAPG